MLHSLLTRDSLPLCEGRSGPDAGVAYRGRGGLREVLLRRSIFASTIPVANARCGGGEPSLRLGERVPVDRFRCQGSRSSFELDASRIALYNYDALHSQVVHTAWPDRPDCSAHLGPSWLASIQQRSL